MAHSKEDLSVLRHSVAHLLAHAVSELYPETLLTIGPATADGFFYDMLPSRSFKEEDLESLSKRMKEIVARALPIEHTEISKTEARKLYAHNPFKLELIDQIPGDTVGLATQGNFYDLCRGGHVAHTGLLGNFKLQHISGSYWRAKRENAALQRISGTAFFTAEELEAYERRQVELAQYDHRVLGKQMDLFSFHGEGVGFPFFHPKGKAIINTMMSYMRGLQRRANYQEICTPTMLNDTLWRRSGHYEHYRENMYFSEIDEQSYAIKPMNCPGAILVYKTRPRSYRELPLKLSEFGHVHRHELSGVLHGLLRVRAFTQDDAHLFCTVDQIESQIVVCLGIIREMLAKFGFTKVSFALATRPASALGNDELWEKATLALKNSLKTLALPHVIEEGGGAFYGPKISVYLEDSFERQWQCSTVQVDFFQPENFDLSYVTPQGDRARPVILHQANFGSLERFFAIVLEHHRGLLPVWIAPVQARILPLTDEQLSVAEEWATRLREVGMRVEVDTSSDPIRGKIKSASEEKIPWMILLGKREVEQGVATLRYIDGQQFSGLSMQALIDRFLAENSFAFVDNFSKKL